MTVNGRVKGVWVCPWCGKELDHTTPYRTALPVEEGWPRGTGHVVCGPGCRKRPSEAKVYQHWNRGAH